MMWVEEIAVGEAERERVGGPVGEAADGEERRVDGVAAEGLRQGAVDEGYVRAVVAAYDVPRRSPRVRREQDKAVLVGQGQQRGQAAVGIAARAVQRQRERGGPVGPVALRHVEEAVAAALQAERAQANRRLLCPNQPRGPRQHTPSRGGPPAPRLLPICHSLCPPTGCCTDTPPHLDNLLRAGIRAPDPFLACLG